MKLLTRLVILLLFLVLLVLPALADPPAKIGLVPVSVSGTYKPMTGSQATEIIYNELKSHPVEVVLLNPGSDVFTLDQAIAAAVNQNVDLVVWGNVSFQKSEWPSRNYPDRFQLKVGVTTVADLKVGWVKGHKQVLAQPTIVSTNDQTKSYVGGEGWTDSEEANLAASSLAEASKEVLIVLKKRYQAGWFQE